MTLPSITAPTGTPVFQEAGHGIEEDSVYAQVQFATGHSRARRVSTVTERVVSVSWFLEADELAAVDDWYQSALQAGTREFSAQVRSQVTGQRLLWWTARWIEFQTVMLTRNRGRAGGRLLLTGDGSETGPELGVLAMEVLVELLDVRSTVSLPVPLAMEVLVELLQPTVLRMEVSIALLNDYFISGSRITEDGQQRTTEDGQERRTEA